MFLRKIAPLAAILLAPTLLFAADANGTFDKTLHVGTTPTFSVSTGSGYIRISPGSDGQIHVVGHVHANRWNGFGSGGGSPEERVKQIVDNPPIEQAGNIVSIGKHTNYRNVSIDYDITLPKGTNLEAGSGSGDIRVSDLNGPGRINTGSGSIEASGLSGRIVLETGSGDIRAEMLSSSSVKAQTGSGSLHLKNVQGELEAGAGSGDIEVQGQPTAPWRAHTGSGSVALITGSSHFSLDAQTGSGSIHSEPSISTHGSMEHHHITGDVNGGGPAVRIETGSGDIRIQ